MFTILILRFLANPFPHLGVSEPAVRFHHGGIEAIGFDVARKRDFHVAHHAQPLHIGVERANAVGEIFRQHRYHAAREIHAGGAFLRILVDGIVGLHIMAHIGDGNNKPIIAPDFFGENCVVKIARGFAIYGYQR